MQLGVGSHEMDGYIVSLWKAAGVRAAAPLLLQAVATPHAASSAGRAQSRFSHS